MANGEPVITERGLERHLDQECVMLRKPKWKISLSGSFIKEDGSHFYFKEELGGSYPVEEGDRVGIFSEYFSDYR